MKFPHVDQQFTVAPAKIQSICVDDVTKVMTSAPHFQVSLTFLIFGVHGSISNRYSHLQGAMSSHN